MALDMSMLWRNLSRPGMDTRRWSSNAIIRHFCIDPEEGPVADVLLLPEGLVETAKVEAFYAGDGFGFYRPMAVDDEVVVHIIAGDPNAGLSISGMVHSPSAPPAQAYLDHPNDVILWIKPKRNFRIGVTDGGAFIVKGTTQIVADPSMAMTPITFYPKDPSETLKENSPKRMVAAKNAPFMVCASSNPSDLNPGQMVIRGSNYLADQQEFLNALGAFFFVLQTWAIGAGAVPVTGATALAVIIATALGPPTGPNGPLVEALAKILTGFPGYLTPNLLVDDPGVLPALPS